MEAPDTFSLLDLGVDPTTKAVTSSSSSLTAQLDVLNSTHRGLLQLSTPNQAPPPPLPVQPQRSAQIGKLRDSAQAALKKQPTSTSNNPSSSEIPSNVSEAIKLYTLAIDMALSRPTWEPSGLLREEAAIMLSGRAEAYGLARQWGDSFVDAQLSIECKRAGNALAYARGGRALVEMGRRVEAKDFLAQGADGENTALQGAKGQLNQLKAQIAQAQAQGQQVPPQALGQVKQMETAVSNQEEALKELNILAKDVA
ncbi:hypothetical protein FH972_023653 [Carpinus fangiana]|uniref:Uncharacterized protein n=1 Tax=Carpinus fangiana TaxID=176857 RepID=A0A5N6KVT3_9ROSI|nr:hypothetical protein FH972_023653 [Carpinus fangiana]